MNMTLGTNLSQEAVNQVKARYIYRLTSDNNYPRLNPCGARIAPITDREWLARTRFPVKANGLLDERCNWCETSY